MSIWSSEIRGATSSSVKHQNSKGVREESEGLFWFCVSRQAWCAVKGDEEWFRDFGIVPEHLDIQTNSVIHLDRWSFGFTFRHFENPSLEWFEQRVRGSSRVRGEFWSGRTTRFWHFRISCAIYPSLTNFLSSQSSSSEILTNHLWGMNLLTANPIKRTYKL